MKLERNSSTSIDYVDEEELKRIEDRKEYERRYTEEQETFTKKDRLWLVKFRVVITLGSILKNLSTLKFNILYPSLT